MNNVNNVKISRDLSFTPLCLLHKGVFSATKTKLNTCLSICLCLHHLLIPLHLLLCSGSPPPTPSSLLGKTTSNKIISFELLLADLRACLMRRRVVAEHSMFSHANLMSTDGLVVSRGPIVAELE